MFLRLKHKLIFMASFAILVSSSILNAQSIQRVNEIVEGQILVEKSSEFYTFKAAAENKTDITLNLRFEFAVFRTDQQTKNTNKSFQKNLFTIASFEKKVLSSVTINYEVEDRIILLVTIYDQEDNVIGQDRLVLDKGGKTRLKLKKEIAPNQDGVFLEGVITQKTLTKSGRDFARDFSQRYYNAQVHSPKNIFIKEVPGRGRNTLITVEVDNNLVWRFFAQPRKEVIQSNAQLALQSVTRYVGRLKQRNDQLINY